MGSGGNGTFSITTDNTCPVGKYSYNVLNNTSGNRDFQQSNIPYVAGKKYTGSWWAKGSGTCLYRVWNQTKQSQPMSQTFTLTSDWKYYTHTFTATQEMEDDNCTFHLGVTGASSIYMCGMKLEQNDHATPWMPSIYDTAYTSMGYNSTTEYDVSGYKYNGTKTGTFAYDIDTPRYSVCTKYSGSNYSYLTSPSSEIRTIAFWAKWDTIPSGQSILFVDGKSKTGFGLASNGIICSSNSVYSYTFNKSNLVANTWYHFVVVCPNGGSNSARKLYINGVEQTATSNQNYWSYSTEQLQIGKRSSSSDGLVGKMSDFRAYSVALSDADILELYNTVASVANNGTLLTRGEIVEA